MDLYIFNYIYKNGSGILIISLLIITGLVFAQIAKKFKLPQITGYILAGIIIGDPFLHLISKGNFKGFQNINLIALGLMSITIGAHLNFHKLKNSGKRVISVLIFESVFAYSFVFMALYFFGGTRIFGNDIYFIMLIASIAIATAPAATVATVKEIKAKGLVVNTMMPVVAMNNVLCILIFGICAIIYSKAGSLTALDLVSYFGKELTLAIVIGIIAGFFLKIFAEKNISSSGHVLTLVFLTVLATTGISQLFDINSMLPCIIIGIVITNTSEYRNTILTIFEEIEYLILIIFFALAGAHIDIKSIGTAGLIGLLYFLARGFGKYFGGYIGAYISKAPKRVYRYVGAALLPQAGVAIGLVIMARNMEALKGKLDFLTTLVLAVVAMNEIFGPPLTKWALTKSGDAGQDRPKLIEFLLEEYINPNLKAETKEEAIEEIITFFIKSHKASKNLEEEIRASVFKREEEASTGIGNGVAIPHGVVSEGPIIWGAFGLSKKGIEFDAIDGKPVNLIVLIVTPKNHKANMHLAVLSQLSIVLSDGNTLEKVFQASTAAEVCEILAEKEHKDFNYFLND